MANIYNTTEVRDHLLAMVRAATTTEVGKFDLYWNLISPNIDALLEQGIPSTKRTGGWRLGVLKLFGSIEGDLVGDLVLAAMGSLAEARKLGVSERGEVSTIVAGYAKALRSISPFSKGIEDFVLHVVSSSAGSFPQVTKGGRSLTIDPSGIYRVLKNGEIVEGRFDAKRLRVFLEELGDQYVVVSGIRREIQFNRSVIPVSEVPYSFFRLLSRYNGSSVGRSELEKEVFFFEYSKLRSHIISYLKNSGALDLAQHVRTNTRTIRMEDGGIFMEKSFKRCYFERVGQVPLD